MDIKAPLEEEKYAAASGVKVDLEKIRQSIALIKNSGIDYEFRTTVVPTIHQLEDILNIAQAIAPAQKFYLQNFRPEKTLNENLLQVKPFSETDLEMILEKIKNLFEECKNKINIFSRVAANCWRRNLKDFAANMPIGCR